MKENDELWYLIPFVAAYFAFASEESLEGLKRYAELAEINKPQELEDKKPQG